MKVVLFLQVMLCLIVSDVFAQSQPTLENYRAIKADLDRITKLNKSGSNQLLKANAIQFEDGRVYKPQLLNPNRLMFRESLDLSLSIAVKADQLWATGASGYNVSGNGVVIGVWESGGYPNNQHNSFIDAAGNERMVYADYLGGPIPYTSHSIDVTSVLGSEGDPSPDLIGVAHESTIWAFTSSYDSTEVAAAAAAGLQVSNHSYGSAAGWWATITPGGAPEPLRSWLGDPSVSAVEDYYYGFYDRYARYHDELVYDNKYYNLVVAVGNDRGTAAPGDPRHYVYTGDGPYSGWEESSELRLGDNHWNGGYDTILGGFQSSKNTISVGSVTNDDAIACRVRNEPAFETAYYSAWGPTDDGRIKPDFTAPGMAFFRPVNSDVNGFNCAGAAGGTSYAAPVVAGGIGLLIEHRENLVPGKKLTAATYKALLAHTTLDLGRLGPDYIYGWGMPDFKKAADLIYADDNAGSEFHIFERELLENGRDIFYVRSDGGELRATLAWTDPPGITLDTDVDDPSPMWLDDPTPDLVNDLDLTIYDPQGSGAYHYAWKLDPAFPEMPATRDLSVEFSDASTNSIDVTEQVIIERPVLGKAYRVNIDHKSLLNQKLRNISAGSQNYSLILSGISSVSLPVELSSFEIVETRTGQVLRWTTQSELNNAGFEVEQKLDGDFETLAFVEGNGTKTEASAYEYLLSDQAYGLAEFRLKQIDHDGTYEYSDVLSYLHELDRHIELSDPYPNPFNPESKITLVLKETQMTTIELFDISGRLVKTVFEGRLDGSKRHHFVIDGSSLPTGQYALRASGETFSEVKSIVLVR